MSAEAPPGLGEAPLGDPVPPPAPPEKRGHGVARALLELVGTVLLALALAWVVQAFVVKPYRIPSGSMIPTLKVGDRVLVDRVTGRVSDPDRFDILVFHPPGKGEEIVPRGRSASSLTFIKRLIGLPGEWVEGKGGKVFICEKPNVGCKALSEPFARPPTIAFGPTHVPKGHYFMMGDNRGNSDDSRDWGTIPSSSIVGLARVVYWPPQRIGPLS